MPDALDAIAEALIRRALATAPADRPRTALDVDGLPSPVARLLHARLDAAVDEAAPRTSAWVGGPDVEAAADAWREAADRAARFPADAWADAVRQAVRRALSHLVRPAETFAAAAFEGADGPLPVRVALDRARAFGPYPYLPQIAARYAERKGVGALERDQLAGLLGRIDRRMVSAFGPDDWMTLLGPLFALVGPVGSPPGSVPTGLLRPLFEAKDADALAAALDGIDAVTPDELRARLAATLTPVTAAPADEPAATGPEASEGASEEAAEPETTAPVEDAPPPPPSFRAVTDDPTAPADRSVATEPPDLSPPPMPDVADDVRPPTIGAKYLAPEYDDEDGSEVLGPPRPAGTTPDAPSTDPPEAPMDEVREAVAGPPADVAPDVPVLDLPPIEPTAPEEPPVPTPPPPPDAPTPDPPPRTYETPETLTVSEPDADEEPIWKRLVRERGDAPPVETPDEPEEAPLWRRFAESELAARLPAPEPGPADAPRRQELDDVEARVLGASARERRDWFVAELFGGSTDAYHRTLARIADAASYTDATHIVSTDVFRAHRVDPYTESAVAFIDAMQVQFDARR